MNPAGLANRQDEAQPTPGRANRPACVGKHKTVPEPMRRQRQTFWLSLPVLVGTMLAGCAVPQPPGRGMTLHRTEPTTKRTYWLYLPEDYATDNSRYPDGKKWPLVMTFHGMKPWDNAKPQIREWQEEADRYGYIVCSPDLVVCDMLKEFPVRTIGRDLLGDEKAILAIMDDVFRRTDADPSQVLSTSWSSGGYIAHYMVNRHPERFSCLSTRQSNFEDSILSAERFAQYRTMPIGLYYTTNDFGVCKRDTLKAIRWYKSLGAANMESGMVQAFGHVRTPEVAADFYARVCGAKPKTPPSKLARIRIDEVPGDALAIAYQPPDKSLPSLPRPASPAWTNYSDNARPPRSRELPPVGKSPHAAPRQPRAMPSTTPARQPDPVPAAYPPRPDSRSYSRPSSSYRPTSTPRVSPRRPVPSGNTADRTADGTLRGTNPPAGAQARPVPGTKRTLPAMPRRDPKTYPPPKRVHGRTTPQHRQPSRRTATTPNVPLSVEVSSTIGIAPLLIDYAVSLPPQTARGADVLWADNGIPIGNGLSGRKVITTAGEHVISVLVITRDDRELRANSKVTVLAPLKRKSRFSR